MADEVSEDIENALNLLVSTVERSGNMKKGLKQDVFETVSRLRTLFVKLTDSRDSKSHTISELEGRITSMKAELQACRVVDNKVHGAPSLGVRQEPSRMTAMGVALPGGSEKKLYSEALGSEGKPTRFKITVTSKENQTSETIRELLKSKVNPTEIKVGINTLKSLRNSKVLIETNTKEEMEILGKDINEKCGDILEAHIHKLRNPRLVIINIPEDITTDNLEDTLLAQNPDLDLVKGDIKAKFSYETKNTFGT
jgi:ribosomal protein L7Ae-like RNA K-turn-binding protein